MSLYDYVKSKEIAALDVPFYVIIMAAMRQADTPNMGRLQTMWSEVHEEMKKRYNAPGGALSEQETRELEKYQS